MNNSGIIFLVILVIAAVIGLVSYIIYRLVHLKVKSDEKLDDQKMVEEELNRVLQPVEDEETAKQISEYKEDEE